MRVVVVVVVVVAALELVSCARSLEELVPFACAQADRADREKELCPASEPPLVCVDGACVREKDCDVGDQELCNGKRPGRVKCTVVEINDGARNQQCVREIGDIDPGEFCARRAPEPGEVLGNGDGDDDDIGLDDCIQGHLCGAPRDPGEAGRCERFCDKPADCDGVLRCRDLDVDGASVGVCVQSCSEADALAQGGCPPNESCKRSRLDIENALFPVCARDGIPEGAACSGDHQCPGDSVCEGDVCVKACNSVTEGSALTRRCLAPTSVCSSTVTAPGFCRRP